MSDITLDPLDRRRRDGQRRRPAAALRLAGAVRPDVGRGDDPGAGALLPGLAVAADVVAAAPAPRRGRLGFLLLAFYATILFSEFLAPYGLDTPQHRLHLRAAAARAHLRRGPARRALRRRLRLSPRHEQSAARLHPEPATSTSRSASSATATRICSGATSRRASTSSARPRAASCSCSAPTGSAAICCRASSTARGSR